MMAITMLRHSQIPIAETAAPITSSSADLQPPEIPAKTAPSAAKIASVISDLSSIRFRSLSEKSAFGSGVVTADGVRTLGSKGGWLMKCSSER